MRCVEDMQNSVMFYDYLIDFSISFFENYLILSLLEMFFEKKKNLTIPLAFLLTMFSSYVNTHIYPPIYASFLLLFFLFIYTFINLEGSLLYKFLVPIFIYANLFILNVST